MISENELQVGDVIGGFKLEKELGRGGMGVVFKAHELSLNRKIALKILASRLSSSDEFVQRFKREAQVIAALRHPNIVNVLSYGEEQGLYYFAMEYVSGKDLGEILRERRVIPFDEALVIVRQVADALAEAGAKGVVHRDIKPSNIMIDQMGRAYVTDFGVAHFTETSEKLTQTGLFLGTPEYASPEQATGRPLDVRSDIYSLGAVLYKMVSGQAPVSGESPLAVVAKITTEKVTPISQVNPLVPKPLCELIDKMMAKELDKRYRSPKDLIGDIDKCIQKIKKKGDVIPLAEHIIKDEEAKSAAMGTRRSYVGILGRILGVALAVLFVVWLVEGRVPFKTYHDNSKEGMTTKDKDSAPEKQPDTGSPVKEHVTPEDTPRPGQTSRDSLLSEDASAKDTPLPNQVVRTEGKKATLPSKDLISKVDKSPSALPKTPTILVIVSGDESLIPSARAHLYSAMRDTGLKIIPFTEIPQLREKMQYGDVPVNWYDIKQMAPAGKAQVLLLAEIIKTGSMPIQYMGRSDELTLATFSFQAVDMETGTSIHSSTSEPIKFTPLNMDNKLQDGIAVTTEGIGDEIQQYWEKRRAPREKSG